LNKQLKGKEKRREEKRKGLLFWFGHNPTKKTKEI
jgi:hypothetical protein